MRFGLAMRIPQRRDLVDFGLASQPSGQQYSTNTANQVCVQLVDCLSRSYWYPSYSCDIAVRVATDSIPCSAFEALMRYGKFKPDAQP
jgi:hypothetical protein